jgi:uncharacterized membrane protein YeaQ/YmgE (transglycosylase-associated protein family)
MYNDESMMNILLWIVFGGLAGWIGSLIIAGSGLGLLGNILVGIAGAFIGGFIADRVGVAQQSPGADRPTSIASFVWAVIGAVVLGLGPGGADAPQADAIADYNTSSNNVTITHRGGDPLDASQVNVSDESGNSVALDNLSNDSVSGGQLTAGESVTITDTDLGGIADGETVTLIWQSPNGDKEVIIKTFDP